MSVGNFKKIAAPRQGFFFERIVIYKMGFDPASNPVENAGAVIRPQISQIRRSNGFVLRRISTEKPINALRFCEFMEKKNPRGTTSARVFRKANLPWL
jgi:hypothetical protein